jgi:tyrosyl-tRNA synthetase
MIDSKINVKEEKIDELLTRGVEEIYPSREFLEKKLKKGDSVSVYLGIDPTGPTLHIGHSVVLWKLKQFQNLGHKVVLLIGDFTAMIGDPTDKLAVRTSLTRGEVMKNLESYQEQASAILDFSGDNPVEFRYNSEWHGKMTFADVLRLASHVTVEQMLKRDMFERRMKEGRPIFIHEFLYPLLQGYDSVALDIDGEIGATDQTFNMLTGRTLVKQMLNKEKFVITTKLLVDETGRKMSKTEGNMIALNDSPGEMFGKIMSWPDGMITLGFELCTDVSMGEIERLKCDLKNGINPREVKLYLAHKIVSTYHGAKEADQAKKSFIHAFTNKGMPSDAPEIGVVKGTLICEALLQAGLISSKMECRRLLRQGAISTIDGHKITDPSFSLDANLKLRVGKHRFLNIKV